MSEDFSISNGYNNGYQGGNNGVDDGAARAAAEEAARKAAEEAARKAAEEAARKAAEEAARKAAEEAARKAAEAEAAKVAAAAAQKLADEAKAAEAKAAEEAKASKEAEAAAKAAAAAAKPEEEAKAKQAALDAAAKAKIDQEAAEQAKIDAAAAQAKADEAQIKAADAQKAADAAQAASEQAQQALHELDHPELTLPDAFKPSVKLELPPSAVELPANLPVRSYSQTKPDDAAPVAPISKSLDTEQLPREFVAFAASTPAVLVAKDQDFGQLPDAFRARAALPKSEVDLPADFNSVASLYRTADPTLPSASPLGDFRVNTFFGAQSGAPSASFAPTTTANTGSSTNPAITSPAVLTPPQTDTAANNKQVEDAAAANEKANPHKVVSNGATFNPATGLYTDPLGKPVPDSTEELAKGSNPDIKADLDKPKNVANYTVDKWDEFKFPPNAKPSDIANDTNYSAEARRLAQYLVDHPALMRSMEVGTGNGTGGHAVQHSVISKQEAKQFAANNAHEQEAAAKDFKEWKANHTGASPQAVEVARSASIVAANKTLLRNGDIGETTDGRGVVSVKGMKAVGAADGVHGYGAISGAAKMWSDPGMFQQLDRAGVSESSNQFDGLVDVGNISSWLNTAAPTTDQGVLDFFTAAASQSAILNLSGNTANIPKDLFVTDPTNGTVTLKPDLYVPDPSNPGKQVINPAIQPPLNEKDLAAALLELKNAKAAIHSAKDKGHWDNSAGLKNVNGQPLNTDAAKNIENIDKKIALLSGIPQVVTVVSAEMKTSFKAIVNSNPAVQAAVTKYYDDTFTKGDGLLRVGGTPPQALNPGGTAPTDLTTGLSEFILEDKFLADALGRPGLKPADMNALFASSPELTAVRATIDTAYKKEFETTGVNPINTLQNGPPPLSYEQAVTATYQHLSAFDKILGASPEVIAAHAAKLNTFTQDAMPVDHVKAGMAKYVKANGELDEAKLEADLDKMEKANPHMFETADGQIMTKAEIVRVAKDTWNLFRHGEKAGSSYETYKGTMNTDPGWASKNLTAAYKSGLLHTVSGLFTIGGLVAKSANGGAPQTPEQIAQTAMTAFAAYTGLGEGATKAASFQYARDPALSAAAKAETDTYNTAKAAWDADTSPTKGPAPTQSDTVKNFDAFTKNKAAVHNAEMGFKGAGGIFNIVASGLNIASILKDPDPISRGLNLAAAGGNIALGAADAIEAGMILFNVGSKAAQGFMGMLTGAAGVFATVASAAAAVYLIVQAGIDERDRNKFWADIQPVLDRYGINAAGSDGKPYQRPVPGINPNPNIGSHGFGTNPFGGNTAPPRNHP